MLVLVIMFGRLTIIALRCDPMFTTLNISALRLYT